MIQLSILKITGYGPWTLTLGSDREHELTDASGIIIQRNSKISSLKRIALVFHE